MDLFNHNGAVISDCGQYRYQLWRTWDEEKPKVLFIMLNPSKADAMRDDPTIRRCIHFAKDWGYGGLNVGNLFAFRATNPQELKSIEDPTGPKNEMHLKALISNSDKVICAWGNNKGWPSNILRLVEKPFYLALTKDGTPKHPLYLKKDLTPRSIMLREL